MDRTEADLNGATIKGACPTEATLTQKFHGGHDGVDLANKKGTPIFAVADGVVTDSGPAQGYGQWIRIRHDDGSMTESGHMYQRDVKVGDRVKAGQQIALMGSEGQSTGPHLHLRVYSNAKRTGSGSGMDPAEYLRARGVTLPCKPGAAAAPDPAPGPQPSPPESPSTSPTPADTSSAVTVSWNRVSTTAEYSLDIFLKNGDLIAPCIDVRTVGRSLSVVYRGVCVSPSIPVPVADIRDFRICSAENGDWKQAICVDADWDGSSRTVKIEN